MRHGFFLNMFNPAEGGNPRLVPPFQTTCEIRSKCPPLLLSYGAEERKHYRVTGYTTGHGS